MSNTKSKTRADAPGWRQDFWEENEKILEEEAVFAQRIAIKRVTAAYEHAFRWRDKGTLAFVVGTDGPFMEVLIFEPPFDIRMTRWLNEVPKNFDEWPPTRIDIRSMQILAEKLGHAIEIGQASRDSVTT